MGDWVWDICINALSWRSSVEHPDPLHWHTEHTVISASPNSIDMPHLIKHQDIFLHSSQVTQCTADFTEAWQEARLVHWPCLKWDLDQMSSACVPGRMPKMVIFCSMDPRCGAPMDPLYVSIAVIHVHRCP